MSFKNKFNILPSGAMKLRGELGKALQLATRNHIMKLDWKLLVDPFRTRHEVVSWCCEFWGKQIRGAILAAYVTRDPELTALIKESVYDMISTQDADGCITSYSLPFSEQKANVGWDGWGRKYVLMGLTRYYQYIEADPKVLEACCRLVDNLMEVVGGGKQDVLEHGCHDGLAFSSILGAIVRVYRISGDSRYLEFAKWIASRGCSKNGDIFQAALNGTKPKDIGNAKAYELTSCYQGLGELCLECDDFPMAVEALTAYYRQVRDREIYVTGIGGGLDLVGEYWNDSAFKQNSTDFEVTGAQGETCVTVTWLHYMERILRLTGDAAVFDECEKSFYNGLLGAMKPDGSNFTHYNPTPLAGKCYKTEACDQMMNNFWFAFGGNDCCRAQGHEGLALAPLMAVMTDAEDGAPVFNLYEDMEVVVNGVTYTVSGGYPFHEDGRANITLQLDAPAEFSVKLRVPAREKGTAFASVNGEKFDGVPGTYLEIRRTWQNGDVIQLTFDTTVNKVQLPTETPSHCYTRGPVLLAYDSRRDYITEKTGACRLYAEYEGQLLCDYASAGNHFAHLHYMQVIFND